MRFKGVGKAALGVGLLGLVGASREREWAKSCGIIGYVGKSGNADEVLSQGISLLQNRGYDSAGIATLHASGLQVSKLTSNFKAGIDCIKEIKTLSKKHVPATVGIGHTRWATCGERTDANSHPHTDDKNRIALVHNGTVFNYKKLKEDLMGQGYAFKSQTDSEVIAVMIGSFLDKGLPLVHAIEKALEPMEGTWGIVVISKDHPHSIFCSRKGSPLVVGIDESSLYVASEQIAFQSYTNQIVYLRENECMEISLNEKFHATMKERITISEKVEVKVTPSPGYDCFYIEEIEEQPEAVRRALSYFNRLLPEKHTSRLGGFDQHKQLALSVNSIVFVACGTSYHAALYGVQLFQKTRAFDSVSAVIASEFCEDHLPKGRVGCIFITQSGETADVMKAAKLAKSLGVVCIGISNVVGSMITTVCDFGVFLNSGREISVAATKSFTTMIVVINLIAVWYSHHKNPGDFLRERTLIVDSMRTLPDLISQVLRDTREKVRQVSEQLSKLSSMILLGKGSAYAMAKEGALKIKEITYIFAETINCGEIKHGPLALVENHFDNKTVFPTHIIIIALDNHQLEEVKLSISEVKSRLAQTIVISDCPERLDLHKVDHLIEIPKSEAFGPLLAVFPMQLMAYEIGKILKVDIDRPRNLAKAVTVL